MPFDLLLLACYEQQHPIRSFVRLVALSPLRLEENLPVFLRATEPFSGVHEMGLAHELLVRRLPLVLPLLKRSSYRVPSFTP